VYVQIEWQAGIYFCNHFSSQKLLMSMLLLELLSQCYAFFHVLHMKFSTLLLCDVCPHCSFMLFLCATHPHSLHCSFTLLHLLLWTFGLLYFSIEFTEIFCLECYDIWWILCWWISAILKSGEIVLTDICHIEIWQNCAHRYLPYWNLALDFFFKFDILKGYENENEN
jgi:hypothetical protein